MSRGPSPSEKRHTRFSYWRIIVAIAASFVGIRSQREMRRDMVHLEKGGFLKVILIGFGLAIALHLIVYLIVIWILPPGSSWALFGGRERVP